MTWDHDPYALCNVALQINNNAILEHELGGTVDVDVSDFSFCIEHEVKLIITSSVDPSQMSQATKSFERRKFIAYRVCNEESILSTTTT